MAQPETNTRKIVARLGREGWSNEGGGNHDKFTNPDHPGVLVTPGVARSIAKGAGWVGDKKP
jgi:predicted RNA binding protein YcfA (HicA-like mRNA interferase family)